MPSSSLSIEPQACLLTSIWRLRESAILSNDASLVSDSNGWFQVAKTTCEDLNFALMTLMIGHSDQGPLFPLHVDQMHLALFTNLNLAMAISVVYEGSHDRLHSAVLHPPSMIAHHLGNMPRQVPRLPGAAEWSRAAIGSVVSML